MYQTLSHSFTGRLNGVTLKSALGILKDWCFFCLAILLKRPVLICSLKPLPITYDFRPGFVNVFVLRNRDAFLQW